MSPFNKFPGVIIVNDQGMSFFPPLGTNDGCFVPHAAIIIDLRNLNDGSLSDNPFDAVGSPPSHFCVRGNLGPTLT